MTIRFRGRSSPHVTPGMRVFVAIVNDRNSKGNFIQGVPGILDLQLRLLLFYTFYMYICIYVSLCNPLDITGRLGVHKTLRKLTFKLPSCFLRVMLSHF